MAAAISGALKYLPATLARKALTKINPKFDSFFAQALTYGVDADRALEYLAQRFESEPQRDYKEQLERGAANQTLRPDEMVSRSQIGNAAIPGKVLRGAASVALGGGLGLGGSKQEAQPPMSSPPIPPEENKRLETLQKFNQKKKKSKEEEERLSIGGLKDQFQARTDRKNKDQLLQQMRALTEIIRNSRGG